MHDELERLWQDTGATAIFVTHNVREAVRLGDRVLVLSSRPARVVETYNVTLPRPRHLDQPDVAALAGRIVDRLRQEVRRHAHDSE
jgi:NitT/TauT family transport system ATP-binding protein